MTEMVKPMGKILVGIAGWSYPDWKGLVFPRETQFNKLEYFLRSSSWRAGWAVSGRILSFLLQLKCTNNSPMERTHKTGGLK